MSICAGCGGEYACRPGCNWAWLQTYQGPFTQQPVQQPMTYGVSSTPTYITDILEALKRIEELLREGK